MRSYSISEVGGPRPLTHAQTCLQKSTIACTCIFLFYKLKDYSLLGHDNFIRYNIQAKIQPVRFEGTFMAEYCSLLTLLAEEAPLD